MSGIKCPVCGAWTEVKETRTINGQIQRRRWCGNMHKFYTLELVYVPEKKIKFIPPSTKDRDVMLYELSKKHERTDVMRKVPGLSVSGYYQALARGKRHVEMASLRKALGEPT